MRAKKPLVILALILVGMFLLTACGKESLEDKTVLFEAVSTNASEVGLQSDFVVKSTYTVYTDGTLTHIDTYSKSGDKTFKNTKLSQKALDLLNEYLDGDFKKYTENYNGIDELKWKMTHYNEDGTVSHEFKGYAYGNVTLQNIITIVAK